MSPESKRRQKRGLKASLARLEKARDSLETRYAGRAPDDLGLAIARNMNRRAVEEVRRKLGLTPFEGC